MQVYFYLFSFWLRTEANANQREAAADRRDILSLIREIKDEMKHFYTHWKKDRSK